MNTDNRIPETGYPSFLLQKITQYNQRIMSDGQGHHIMRGMAASQDDVQVCSNDYLSLANHPEIIESQVSVLQQQSDYMLMSAVFLDEGNSQIILEKQFAQFLGTGDSILCQSGYAANVGLIQAIIENSTIPVYIDMYTHMSLWDGIHMAGQTPIPFRHNDVSHLENLIRKKGPGLVVVDSVYSTNGSVCPLLELVNMAHGMGCTLLVDESHSLGTHGPQGKGMVVEYGLEDKVMFITASLAKAFAGRAGLIACPKGFPDFFKCTSKPSIFSSTMLPYEVAGLQKTLELVINADDRRQQLHKNTVYLQKQLAALGYNIEDSQAQIIALESGSEWETIRLRDALESRGIFGSVFCAPATAKTRALVRFSINAGLSELELHRIVRACREIVDELDVANWKSSLRKLRSNRVPADLRKSA